ncbi:uncharacterized protein LOC119675671, partial [Teleopsis dalmanni]
MVCANDEDNFHPAPVWLTAEYLEKILQENKKDNTIRVTDLEIKPATAKGENYASIMTRVKVDFIEQQSKDTQHEYYIVKTTYENDPVISKIMSAYHVDKTEMIMYEKILPELSKLLQEIGDDSKLFADTIHVDYEHSAIIFEDLAVSDFILADRLEGMDMLECKLALKKLAKMHATAAVLNVRHGGILEKFDHGIFNRHTKGFAPFFENLIGVSAEFAGECTGLGEYYKEKLLKLKEHVVEYATRVYDPQPGHFLTLTHGDFWVNNMMVSYDKCGQNGSKEIKDLILIDFQFCTWSSPAVDLHYFFNTSMRDELRFNHQDEFIQYYYNILVQTLHELKFTGKIPSLHELCVQLEAGRFYAVTSTLVVQPIMINDNTENADMNALLMT